MLAVTFTSLAEEFRLAVVDNRESLLQMAKKNPHMAYQKVNELALFVGTRHGVNLQLHFPVPSKVSDVDSYGTENIGIMVDKFRRIFPIPRKVIKQKAAEMLGANVQDAYMYEGKEGVKVLLQDGGRMEILPGSVHLWCKVDDKVRAYADWLMENVYFPKII